MLTRTLDAQFNGTFYKYISLGTKPEGEWLFYAEVC